MRGFLRCGDDDDNEDGDGTVPPLLGYVISTNENHVEAFKTIKPQFVRLAGATLDNFNRTVNRVRWYRSRGVWVVLLIADRNNAENTPVVAEHYAKFLRSDGVIYECWNEPNLMVPPWADYPSNYLDPDRYFNIFTEFRNRLKIVDPNIKVTLGGLAGGAKDKEGTNLKSVSALTYRQRLADLGIVPLIDYWNFHTYGDKKFYTNLAQCRKLDPGKQIIIGEFGSDRDEATKIAHYKKCIDRFTANKISIAIVYAWENGGEWSVCTKPAYKECIRTYRRHPSTIQ